MKTIFYQFDSNLYLLRKFYSHPRSGSKVLFFRFEVLQSDPAQSHLSLTPAYTSYVPVRWYRHPRSGHSP